jgi:SAM-dependent methyltransferase
MRGTCRFCGAALERTFVDLGMSPLCETFLSASQLNDGESFYPLHVRVCDACLLVQLDEYVDPGDIFREYAYFSSYSDSWLEHCRTYAEMIIERLGLGRESRVVELASNDGYLLQYFAAHDVPVLGIEPAANVAQVAIDRGIPTMVEFFDTEVAERLAADGTRADLVVANNVLAQVPDLNGFVEGMRIALAPGGVITAEFPHLMRLVEGTQFDTIYHEHFSYFSLATIERIFSAHGLTVFDVEELPTHGGSVRVYARHESDRTKPVADTMARLRSVESDAGLHDPACYSAFGARVEATRYAMLEFLIEAKRSGKRVVGYGAPGKGNTFLNFCGVRADLLEFTVDRSPYKQGKFLPGTHIPVESPERIFEVRPDYVLILPWNIADEIVQQMAGVREWGGRFVVAIPEVRVLS